MDGVGIPMPEIEKFMPVWACFTLVGFGLAAFLALLIVFATTNRRRNEDRE
jgi:hypothetical protein